MKSREDFENLDVFLRFWLYQKRDYYIEGAGEMVV
jgi:hypothetical protein